MIQIETIPVGAPVSENFTVCLNDVYHPALHEARVSAVPYNTLWPGCQRPIDQTELASFFSFSADEPVHVRLEAAHPFQKAVIRPLSRGIALQVRGNVLEFTLEKPGQYVMELDGSHQALHIFMNPVCDFGVDVTAPTVRYFGPGVHHPGLIELQSGETVFIDAGAVVYGAVRAINACNVRLVGYGILDGSEEERTDDTLLIPFDFDALLPTSAEAMKAFLEENRVLHGCAHFYRCRNVEVAGVTFRDSVIFTVLPAACENVICDNVKLIGMWRYNSDGIDFFNCTNGVVRNSFLRNFDDCVVLKGMKGWDDRIMENIRVSGCVVWCDWGRALEIGAETCADEYRNIVFEDCDIVHGAHILMDLQNDDRAYVHDLRFENIRCEYSADQLPPVYQHDMTKPYEKPETGEQPVLFCAEMENKGEWSHDGLIGRIDHITLRNIRVFCEDGVAMPASLIRGVGPEHMTTDILIDGLYCNGVRLHTPEEAGLQIDAATTERIQLQ